MDAQVQLDTAERAAIVAEYRRQAQEPHRPNYSPLGCLLALLAIAIFFGGPWAVAKLGLHFPLPRCPIDAFRLALGVQPRELQPCLLWQPTH